MFGFNPFAAVTSIASNVYIGYIAYKGIQARDFDPIKVKELGKAILKSILLAPLDFAATVYGPGFARFFTQSAYQFLYSVPPLYFVLERGNYHYWENICMEWGAAYGGPLFKASVAVGGLCALYYGEQLATYLGHKAYDYFHPEACQKDTAKTLIFSGKEEVATAATPAIANTQSKRF